MKPKHVHKYQRIYLGGRRVEKDENGKKRIVDCAKYEVFRCMIPGCPTYKTREIVIGDKSICWKCDQELILTLENTRLKKPTHINCRKVKIQSAA